jgi:hypothetical protein
MGALDRPQRHQHQMIAAQMSFTSVAIFPSHLRLKLCLFDESTKGR